MLLRVFWRAEEVECQYKNKKKTITDEIASKFVKRNKKRNEKEKNSEIRIDNRKRVKIGRKKNEKKTAISIKTYYLLFTRELLFCSFFLWKKASLGIHFFLTYYKLNSNIRVCVQVCVCSTKNRVQKRPKRNMREKRSGGNNN